jgi:hypothetical protein
MAIWPDSRFPQSELSSYLSAYLVIWILKSGGIVPGRHLELHLIRDGERDCVGDQPSLGKQRTRAAGVRAKYETAANIHKVCHVGQF